MEGGRGGGRGRGKARVPQHQAHSVPLEEGRRTDEGSSARSGCSRRREHIPIDKDAAASDPQQ